MIEFLLSGGPEGTNDLLYLIISNDGHYYYYYYYLTDVISVQFSPAQFF